MVDLGVASDLLGRKAREAPERMIPLPTLLAVKHSFKSLYNCFVRDKLPGRRNSPSVDSRSRR